MMLNMISIRFEYNQNPVVINVMTLDKIILLTTKDKVVNTRITMQQKLLIELFVILTPPDQFGLSRVYLINDFNLCWFARWRGLPALTRYLSFFSKLRGLVQSEK